MEEVTPENIAAAISGVVAVAAAISAALPSKTNVPWLDAFLKVVNILGLNVGKAKNADDV